MRINNDLYKAGNRLICFLCATGEGFQVGNLLMTTLCDGCKDVNKDEIILKKQNKLYLVDNTDLMNFKAPVEILKEKKVEMTISLLNVL